MFHIGLNITRSRKYRVSLSLKNLLQLFNPNDRLRLALVKGSSIERFLRTSPDPKYIHIWNHMRGNGVRTSGIGVERLKSR